MIFKSEPNMYVKVSNKYIQRLTRLKGFYFDKDGLFETEKEILIKALTGKFEIVEPEEEITEVKEEPIKEVKKPTPKKPRKKK